MTQTVSISDVSLHIDELKSDDPMIKVGAVGKVLLIAESLSPNRIETEFLPYLTFIATETDCEDEFLFKLSENVLKLLEINQEIAKTAAIPLFEPLAVLEDARTRESAVKGLTFVSQKHKNEVQLVAKRLLSFSTTGKVSALEIMASMIREGCFDAQMIVEFDRIMVAQFGDSVLAVRRAALRALNRVWENRQQIATMVKPATLQCLGQSFLRDVQWLYGLEVSESLLFELLEPSLLKHFAEGLEPLQASVLFDKLLDILGKPETNWRVKYMILSSRAPFPTKMKNPQRLADLFIKVLKSEEQEIRCAAMREMAALYSDVNCEKHIQAFHDITFPFVKDEIAKDKNPYTRENFVVLLRSMLINEVGSETISLAATELFSSTFQAFIQESKVCGFEFVESLFCASNFETSRQFLERLGSVAAEKSWKMRMALLEKLATVIDTLKPALSEKGKDKTLLQDFLERCLDLQLKFGGDHVLMIRKRLMENLLAYKGIIDDARLLRHVDHLFDTWINSKTYIFRITALQSFETLRSAFQWREVEHLAKKLVKSLKEDKVPNVRINLLKMMIASKRDAEALAWRKLAREVLDAEAHDGDRDVLSFAEQLKALI